MSTVIPTHREIRSALAAKISTITDIGEVHEYERWSKRNSDFESFYKLPATSADDADRICGWYIRRVAPSSRGGATMCATRSDAWEVRGFMSLADEPESELAFDDKLDAIMELLHQSHSIAQGVHLVDGEDGQSSRLIQSAPVMFAGVLCHSATIALTTEASC